MCLLTPYLRMKPYSKDSKAQLPVVSADDFSSIGHNLFVVGSKGTPCPEIVSWIFIDRT